MDMRVLIVEDDPNLQVLWGAVMEEQDNEYVTCDRQSEALAHLSTELYDLVILDLSLQDGISTDLARDIDSMGQGTKVLVVTGSRDYPNGELFNEAQCIRAVLRKPVNIEDLVEVSSYVGKSKMSILPTMLNDMTVELPT